MQVEKIDPEILKKLSTNSIENMGVKELLNCLRRWNAERNRGELNEQLIEWIVESEEKFHTKIAEILKVGNHKVQLTYYGIIYTILEYTGCYLKGKSKLPIGISRSKYCSLLKLTERLSSNNVRKALSKGDNGYYSHNYLLVIESRRNGEVVIGIPKYIRLEPIIEELADTIKQNFIE